MKARLVALALVLVVLPSALASRADGLAGSAGGPEGTVLVRGEDGRPAAGAWLACGGPSPRGEVVASAGADGRLLAGECGDREAWVGAPGFVPARAPAGGGEVHLRRGAVVVGRVVGPDGKPAAGAVVVVRDRLREVRQLAAADGGFRADGLAPGEVRVRAERPPLLAAEVRCVATEAGGPPLRLALAGRASLRWPGPGTAPGKTGPLRVRIRAAEPRAPTWLDGGVPVLPREAALPAGADEVPGVLPAGVPLLVDAAPAGCAPVRVRLTLHAGDNVLELPCHRGTVTGRVVLPDGADRDARATVEARPRDEAVRELLAWAGGATATTDAEGRWTLGPLPPGSYDLLVRAPGAWLPGAPVVTVAEAGVTDAGTLRTRPGVVLAGRVLAGDEPIAGARVRCAPAGRGRRWGPATTTDGEGRFLLSVPHPGPWLLEARAPHRAPVLLRGVRAPREDLVLRAGPGAGLRFTLAGPDGLPLPSARVLLLAPASGRLLAAHEAEGDEDGEFRLDGLAPGEVTVRVVPPGFSPVDVRRVTLEAGETADLGELVAGRGRLLAGIVLDPDGNPVADALLRPAAAGPGEASFETHTGPDGRFTIPGAPVDSFDLLVAAAGWAPLRTTVPAGGPGREDAGGDELTLHLHRGARVDCLVEEADGRPVPGARIEVVGYPGLRAVATDRDGRAVLEHAPPGPVRLRALLDPADPAAGTITRDVVLPEGGEREVTFRAGLSLAGIVTRGGAPVPGARVAAVLLRGGSAGDGLAAGWTDDDGRFRLGLAGPGTWSVDVRTGGCRFHRPVEVRAGGAEIEIALPPVDLAGTIVDAESGDPLPGARVSWSAGREGSRGEAMVELPDGGWEAVAWDTSPGSLAVADGEGAWVMCVPAEGPLPLAAEGDDAHLPWEKTFEELPPSPLVVPLERRPRDLRLRVRLADGAPGAGGIGLVVQQRGGMESVTFLPPSGERVMPMPGEPFRAWAIVRGYGLARTGWFDPRQGEVPEEGIEITVERGGWIRLALAPALAARIDPSRFRLHLYDDEGNDLFARVEQGGAIVSRAGGAPGEVLLGMFPRGTWRLAWEAGDEHGSTEVVVDEDPPPVVLGGE